MSFKIGKTKEKPGNDTAEAGDALDTQITDIEKQISDRTKDLEAAKQQLRELGNMAKDSKNNEEPSPRPHGPLVELSVEPEDAEKEEETDVSISVGQPEEGVKLVEVKPGETVTTEAKKIAEVKTVPAAPATVATPAAATVHDCNGCQGRSGCQSRS